MIIIDSITKNKVIVYKYKNHYHAQQLLIEMIFNHYTRCTRCTYCTSIVNNISESIKS
jgi:hypothetical protein